LPFFFNHAKVTFVSWKLAVSNNDEKDEWEAEKFHRKKFRISFVSCFTFAANGFERPTFSKKDVKAEEFVRFK